jgi:hypothetical protein
MEKNKDIFMITVGKFIELIEDEITKKSDLDFDNLKISVSEQLKIIFTAVSNYMRTFFEKIKEIEFGDEFIPYTFVLSEKETKDIKMNRETQTTEYPSITMKYTRMYRIIMRNRITNDLYILDCLELVYENSGNPLYNGKYKMISQIRPMDSKITEYGVYDKYFPAGVVCHKLIEYGKQLGNMNKHDEDKDRYIKDNTASHPDEQYYFIGDLIQIYPLVE